MYELFSCKSLENESKETVENVFSSMKLISNVLLQFLNAGFHLGRGKEVSSKVEDWIISFEEPTLKKFKQHFKIEREDSDILFVEEFLWNPQFRQEITITMQKVVINFCLNNDVVERKDLKKIFTDWNDINIYEYCNEMLNNTKKYKGYKLPDYILKASEKYSDFDYSKLKIATRKLEKMMLRPDQIESLNSVMKEIFDVDKIKNIVDGNAGSGADTINFSLIFPNAKIISVEKDSDKFAYLEENLENFNQDMFEGKRKFYPFEESIIDFLKDFDKRIDILYYDPPWDEVRDMLYLDNIEISDIIKDNLSKLNVKHVLLKVPKEYDYSSFCKKFNNCETYDIISKFNNKVSYRLIHLEN